MRTIFNALVIASLLTSIGAHAQAPAKIVSHQRANATDRNVVMAQIKSRAALDEYMQTTLAKQNPILELSKDGQDRFVRSLTFNELGLTGYTYEPLERELNPVRIYNILKLFGAQDATKIFTNAKIFSSKDKDIMTRSTCYDPLGKCNGPKDIKD